MKTWLRRILGRLASPRLVLYVLLFLSLYSLFAAWLGFYGDQLRSFGGLVAALAPEHPFLSPIFLLAGALLFFSTFACTLTRWPQINARWSGKAAGSTVPLQGDKADVLAFLHSEGFRGSLPRLYRFKFAFWGSWVMHVGLLFLIAGILVERAFHDDGAFALSQGETLNLSSISAVFNRQKGPLASSRPPEVEVTLLAFDPERHQQGYAPDRFIRLEVSDANKSQEMTLDRAAGGQFGDLIFHPAIQTGIALNLRIPGQGIRAVHLIRRSDKSASSSLVDLAGNPVVLGVDSERSLIDPTGTGHLQFWLERNGQRQTLRQSEPFSFGYTEATLMAPTRWAGFTYRRSAGVSAVWIGFAIILLGSTILVFPAGLADIEPKGDLVVARILLVRGSAILPGAWNTFLAEHNKNPERRDSTS